MCLRCQVLSWEGLYEWDMLTIKILKNNNKNKYLWCPVLSHEVLYEWDELPIKMFKKKSQKKSQKNLLTGVCLAVAVGLTQDLTLILSPKKHQQNKENLTQARIHLLQKKIARDSLWRIYVVCYCQQQHPWKCQLWRRYAVCYYQPHCEEDMLCVTASLIAKKICCVLLPASWWRYAESYCQPHCEKDIAVYFYQCVYQIECLQCQVPRWRVCMSGAC